jgi:hypothetical protein
MNVQSEKSFLIDMLQNINDVDVIQKVKNFVLNEIESNFLSNNQKKKLDERLLEHKNNPNEGIDGIQFLDNLKLKYGL